MIVVDGQLLDNLTRKAIDSPRLRMNHNLHPADGSLCHRLLNAMEPGSYIRPHRHLSPEKDEGFVLIRGRLGVLEFNEQGQVTATALLTTSTDRCIVDIPHNVFHTAVSLQPGTIFYETKSGPYLPLTEAEKANWAPAENDPQTTAYLRTLCALFPC